MPLLIGKEDKPNTRIQPTPDTPSELTRPSCKKKRDKLKQTKQRREMTRNERYAWRTVQIIVVDNSLCTIIE